MAVLDISNAWEDRIPNLYLGPARVGTLLNLLQAEFAGRGLFVVTAPVNETRDPGLYGHAWAYTGFQMIPSQRRSPVFWQAQAAFMDSYQRQRQVELGRQVESVRQSGGPSQIEWAELAELLYR